MPTRQFEGLIAHFWEVARTTSFHPVGPSPNVFGSLAEVLASTVIEYEQADQGQMEIWSTGTLQTVVGIDDFRRLLLSIHVVWRITFVCKSGMSLVNISITSIVAANPASSDLLEFDMVYLPSTGPALSQRLSGPIAKTTPKVPCDSANPHLMLPQ
jgi:hypothetical protein